MCQPLPPVPIQVLSRAAAPPNSALAPQRRLAPPRSSVASTQVRPPGQGHAPKRRPPANHIHRYSGSRHAPSNASSPSRQTHERQTAARGRSPPHNARQYTKQKRRLTKPALRSANLIIGHRSRTHGVRSAALWETHKFRSDSGKESQSDLMGAQEDCQQDLNIA